MPDAQPQFSGSIPENYERYLAPLLFRPFAESMAQRVEQLNPEMVLELACGTGVVTRLLASALPAQTRIIATDFSHRMLAVAERNTFAKSPIEWQVADACELPFDDSTFDAVVCQFGVMFFPDKAAAMAEALRVLVPGGHLVFNTWGPLSMNPIFEVVESTLGGLFPHEETPFMPTPVSMPKPDEHAGLIRSAGFRLVEVVPEELVVGPADPTLFARGFTHGTPLGKYLNDQGYDITEISSALTANFATAFSNPMVCTMQAIVCHAVRP